MDVVASSPPPAWPRALGRSLTIVVGTALAYAVAGWLALQLRVPPDYALVVFFPAGVAAGAALTLGWAALPGVALGAIAVQILTHDAVGASWQHWGILAPAAGATAMAGATAWGIRRAIGYPSAFDEPAQVIRLFFVIVPLGALLNASISVPTLVARGIILPGDAWGQWASWWIGDALGTVLILPLVLVLLGEPRAAWAARRWNLALPLLLALLLGGSVVRLLADAQTQQLRLRAEQAGTQAAQTLQRRLDAQLDALEAMGQLLARDPAIGQEAFEDAAGLWLRRYPGTQNFTFNWRVTRAQRPHYECCDPGWPILGRDADGRRFPAPDRDEHMVITRLAPLETNIAARGLDVMSYAPLRTAVERAIASGRPQATEPFRLVQETGVQRGIVVYHAVRAPAQAHTVLGIVSSAFRMGDVTQAALDALPLQHLALCLIDLDAAPGNRRLAGADGCETADAPAALPVRTDWPLRFAQRHWLLRLQPGDGFWRLVAADARLHLSASTGFLAVGLLAAFLLVISGQRRRTEQLVQQRTLELARSHASLMQLAHFDALTGLVNRSFWTEQAHTVLATARASGQEVGIVFLDLDRFKHINDSLGHTQGDRLLQTVAARLQGCLRARDVLGRFGGDEFVVLLPWIKGREGAATVARKIARTLDEPITLHGTQVRVGASLGVAVFPHDGDTVDALLRQADTAMYAAKAAGRNQWRFFEPTMHAHVSRRLAIETALRQTLDDPAHSGLSLVYQPQVSAQDQRVLGLEVLLRWQHPALGPIPPGEFIGVAEDAGIIDRLGAWVLQTACHQFAAWHAGPQAPLLAGVRLAVNCSPIEFARPGFVEQVLQAVAPLGPLVRLLELEITESLLVQSGADVAQRMRALTERGIGLTGR
ncbi:putative signaling protein [Tepidimonas thermarum]|uniref:Putative signaling protein n=1 Tax=Tepidimonas thermarum TaxID=335431 RepID=A0A554WVQ4_9BURK|nr:diguanylate cyclase [Tepidimonas thermarum]TSE27647.1 putative signaling protein [Tepidimonas thermarum]